MIVLPRHNGAGERDLIRSFTHFKGALRDLPGKQKYGQSVCGVGYGLSPRLVTNLGASVGETVGTMGGRVCGRERAWTVGIRLYTEGSAVAFTKALTSRSNSLSSGRTKVAQKVSKTVCGGASATWTRRCVGVGTKAMRAHRFIASR